MSWISAGTGGKCGGGPESSNLTPHYPILRLVIMHAGLACAKIPITFLEAQFLANSWASFYLSIEWAPLRVFGGRGCRPRALVLEIWVAWYAGYNGFLEKSSRCFFLEITIQFLPSAWETLESKWRTSFCIESSVDSGIFEKMTILQRIVKNGLWF